MIISFLLSTFLEVALLQHSQIYCTGVKKDRGKKKKIPNPNKRTKLLYFPNGRINNGPRLLTRENSAGKLTADTTYSTHLRKQSCAFFHPKT